MHGASEEDRISTPEAQDSLQLRLKSTFAAALAAPVETEPHLFTALADTLARTGNFIRAELAYNVARAYHLTEADSERLAIAIEYFHTASLLFDDLPSMDNATHRRGALCVHHVHGEGSTILAALALINRAYALLWQAIAAAPAPHQRIAHAYIERYLGLGGLLNGQSRDIHYAALPASQRDPQQVALGKTVALIRLSLVLPAIVGGADQRAVQLLDRLAIFWGLAYQVLDDLKDLQQESGPGSQITSPPSGKTSARDTLLDRPNMALTLGYNATVVRLQRLIVLGDRTVYRLQHDDPSLTCLDRVGERFHRELNELQSGPAPLTSTPMPEPQAVGL